MFRREEWGLVPLAEEDVPQSPPHPGLVIGETDPELRRQWIDGTLIGTYLAGDLARSAARLAELAERQSGRFSEGMAVPESCMAAAAGSIAIACAAIEATLNDMLLTADWIELEHGAQPESRLIRLSIGLPVDRRVEAMAAISGRLVDWGSEPFQSLTLLLSVRKHLLHHEGGLVKAGEGHWPAKKLREVANRVGSPYSTDEDIPLPWYVHVLNPSGASWAVRVAWDVLDELDELQRAIEESVVRHERPEGDANSDEATSST